MSKAIKCQILVFKFQLQHVRGGIHEGVTKKKSRDKFGINAYRFVQDFSGFNINNFYSIVLIRIFDYKIIIFFYIIVTC